MKVIHLSLLGLFASGVATADEFSVLSYGTSIPGHCEASPVYCGTLKGTNPRLGLEWEFPDGAGDGKWISRLDSYRDSFDKTIYFAGAGWRREWPVAGPVYGGVTLLAGYLNSSSGKSEPMALPLFTLGVRDMALRVGYLPGLNLVEISVSAKDLALEVGYIPNVTWGAYKGKSMITTFSLRGTF